MWKFQNDTLGIMQNTAYLIWKGQNRKPQNMEFRLKSVFQWGYFNFICYAEQYKNVIWNKKCIEFTMGQTRDDYGMSLPSVGQRLIFVFSWAHCDSIGVVL